MADDIKLLIIGYAHAPDWRIARKLTSADKPMLLALYRQEPSLVKKRALTIALGFVGDEEVVDVFMHALSDQYAGRKLDAGKGDNETNEEIVMHTTVEALGFLANQSDKAYALLKNGIEPGFWKEYCQFIPARGSEFYGTLAIRSIQAIGWSGRSDVADFLETLKTQPLVNSLDTSIMQASFHGGVVDAAFANDMITLHGLDFYKQCYLGFDLLMEQMTAWKKEGNGLEWRRWARQKEGAPPP